MHNPFARLIADEPPASAAQVEQAPVVPLLLAVVLVIVGYVVVARLDNPLRDTPATADTTITVTAPCPAPRGRETLLITVSEGQLPTCQYFGPRGRR